MSRKKLSKKELEKLTKENSKDNNKEAPKDNKILKFFSSRKNVVLTGLILLLTISIGTPLIIALNKKPQKPKEDPEVIIVDGDNKKSPETIEETTKEHRINKPHRRQPKETVIKETSKETQKETKKETVVETSRETEKETPKETKEEIIEVTPRKETHKETQKEAVRTTETQLISFNTIDNYASTGGKSRVYQEGRNGERTIVKEDGKIVSNKVTRNPQDKIIERYVKVQDKKVETREVEDKSKPVYRTLAKDRWFVHNDLTGETKYFYSAGEAEDYMTNNRILGNWGTADPEITKGPLIGYDTKKEEVVVQEEKWEWKH